MRQNVPRSRQDAPPVGRTARRVLQFEWGGEIVTMLPADRASDADPAPAAEGGSGRRRRPDRSSAAGATRPPIAPCWTAIAPLFSGWPRCTERRSGCRRCHAGDLDRRASGHRSIRGEVIAQDLDLPDPGQQGEDGGPARGTHHHLLRPRRRRAAPAVDPERFHEHGPNRGRWSIAPQEWDRPEEHLLSKEARAVVERAIAALPARQRLTITMRDIEDLGSAHTCSALGISEGNQRLLLHRARSKVRAALEAYFSDVTDAP